MSISFLSTVHEHNNLTGRAWLLGTSQSSRYNFLRSTDLSGINLFKKISSARVYASSVCDGTVIYFGFPHFNINMPDFTGYFVQITDRKNATTPQDLNQFSSQNLNDGTQSALAVATNRTGTEIRLSFRDLFLDKWKTFLDAELGGSQAKRDGDPTLTWEMWPQNISYLDSNLTYLKIHQDLNIELDWWPDYNASVTYHIYLYLNSRGKLNGYVARWAYWVEGGIKSSAIGDRLRPKIIAGMDKLNTELNNNLSAWSSFTFKDLFYLPGNQTSRPPSGVLTGWTTSDTTIVLVL